MPEQRARRKRGKRGGSSAYAAELRDIHSTIRGGRAKQDGHNLHGTSITAVIADKAAYSAYAEIEEDRENFIVPRQSLTRKQLLEFFPQRMEFEPIPTRQLDKASVKGRRFLTSDGAINACRMIGTEENRRTWQSDKTLLNRSKPFDGERAFKREGSVSEGANTRKTITTVLEPDNTETIIGTAVEGDDVDFIGE